MYACQLLQQVTQTTPACVPDTTPGYPDHSCLRASYYTRLSRPLLLACQLLRQVTQTTLACILATTLGFSDHSCTAWGPNSGNSAAHNGYVFPYKDNLLKIYPWIKLIYNTPIGQADLQHTHEPT